MGNDNKVRWRWDEEAEGQRGELSSSDRMWRSCCGRTLGFCVHGDIEDEADEDADEVTVNGAGLTC